MPAIDPDRRRKYYASYAAKWPEKVRARGRVSYAVATGKLPRVYTQACVDCGNEAAEYDHHLGYAVEHALDVQPVCQACHGKRSSTRGEVRKRTRRATIVHLARCRRWVKERMDRQYGDPGWYLSYDAIWCDEGATRRLRQVDDFGNPDAATPVADEEAQP